MKQLSIIFFLIISQCIIAQEELIDAINTIREEKAPENGKTVCTDSYWNAEKDGGKRAFTQFAKMPSAMELKVIDKKTEQDRAVLTVHLMMNGQAMDEIYIYALKEGEQWLMDGINESKYMVKYFMEGKCSGHFDPASIPANEDLQSIAETMLKHTKDSDALKAYMQEVFTEDSDYASVVEQFTDAGYDKVMVSGAGYSEDFGKGYIYFTQIKSSEDYESDITIYLKRTGMGTYEVYDYAFASPSANSYLR